MDFERIKKYIVPPGPILSLTLIGILFLAGVLYYRAVRIQRFLEPAVAISQPRIQFAENISLLVSGEFGSGPVKGVSFTTNSILVDKNLLKDATAGPIVIKKLGRIFLAMLKDPQMRNYIDSILINSRPALNDDPSINWSDRLAMQHMSERVLDSLYKCEPELGRDYDIYFGAVSMSVAPAEAGWVEFKVVSSEQIHIDVLLRLEKYVR